MSDDLHETSRQAEFQTMKAVVSSRGKGAGHQGRYRQAEPGARDCGWAMGGNLRNCAGFLIVRWAVSSST